MPIPKERHSAHNSSSLHTWELFPEASRERLERPWAPSGDAAALGEQGRRFENCGCEPRCSNKVNNGDLWQDCFFAVWVFMALAGVGGKCYWEPRELKEAGF